VFTFFPESYQLLWKSGVGAQYRQAALASAAMEQSSFGKQYSKNPLATAVAPDKLHTLRHWKAYGQIHVMCGESPFLLTRRFA
jgi:hypothetical protein